MELNDLSYLIIQCGIEVHRILGPGLLESTYRKCMIYELGLHKLSVVSEKIVPVRYKELVLEAGYRVDLIVQDTIIVELKAVEHVLSVHQQQLLNVCEAHEQTSRSAHEFQRRSPHERRYQNQERVLTLCLCASVSSFRLKRGLWIQERR